MSRGARSASTMAVLVVTVALAGVWGWRAATAPMPTSTESDQPAACRDLAVEVDDVIRPNQVVVSVLNASGRAGLASQVMQQLQGLGFAQGEVDNVTADVVHSQIWTESPATPLLKDALVGTRIVPTATDYPGLVLVVGAQFDGLTQGKKSMIVTTPGTVCTPPTTAAR